VRVGLPGAGRPPPPPLVLLRAGGGRPRHRGAARPLCGPAVVHRPQGPRLRLPPRPGRRLGANAAAAAPPGGRAAALSIPAGWEKYGSAAVAAAGCLGLLA